MLYLLLTSYSIYTCGLEIEYTTYSIYYRCGSNLGYMYMSYSVHMWFNYRIYVSIYYKITSYYKQYYEYYRILWTTYLLVQSQCVGLTLRGWRFNFWLRQTTYTEHYSIHIRWFFVYNSWYHVIYNAEHVITFLNARNNRGYPILPAH